MALTLVEAAKGERNIFTRGVIETFIENVRLSQVIPYRPITGALDGIERESVLPTVANRAVNQGFTASEGKTEEIIQALKITGGDIGIDPFILQTKGAERAAAQVALKIKAISNKWITDFFKGDSAVDARDFDGLQIRTTQIVEAAGAVTTDGGDALRLIQLDEAILQCHNPQYIAMSRRMMILLNAASRSSTVGGYVRWDRNAFGRQVMLYGDLEIIPVADNSNNDNILTFTEVGAGGSTATAASLYILGTGDEGVEGIQNGGFQVRNLGEDHTTPREDTRVEWYNNYQINHPRSVVRVRGILNAAVVV